MPDLPVFPPSPPHHANVAAVPLEPRAIVARTETLLSEAAALRFEIQFTLAAARAARAEWRQMREHARQVLDRE